MASRSRSVFSFIVDRPGLVACTWILIALGLAYPASQFKIDASADTLLTKNNAAYLKTREINRDFTPEEFLIVAYGAREKTVLEPTHIEAIGNLVDELKGLERVKSVTSLVNVPLLSARPLDQIMAKPLETTIEKNNYSQSELESIFKDHPLYQNLVLSKDHRYAAIQVQFRKNPELTGLHNKLLALDKKQLDGASLTDQEQQDYDAYKARATTLEAELNGQRAGEFEKIQAIAHKYSDKADIHFGGAHVLGQELIQIVKSDLKTFGLMTLAIVSVVLLLFFRSLRWLAIIFACCAIPVTITTGLLALLDLRATVISANFIAVQVVLTIAMLVHLVTHLLESQREQPEKSLYRSLLDTMTDKAKPTLYAALTTSIGFVSMVFTDIQPVIDLGWMMLCATLVSASVVLTGFPAFCLALWRSKVPPAIWRMNWLSRTIVAMPRWKAVVIPGTVIVGVVCSIAATGVTVENSFINYFDKDTETYQGLKVIDQNLGGTTPLDVIYHVPPQKQKSAVVLSSDSVQALGTITRSLESAKGMGRVLSVYDFTELARNINEKPLTEYELDALYKLVDKEIRQNLVGSYFDPETNRLRVSARIVDTTEGLNRQTLLQNIKQQFKEHGVPLEQVEFANLFVVYKSLLAKLFDSQILMLGIVLPCMLLALMVLFRSITAALITMVPNLIALVVFFGLIGFLGIPLDFMTITIAAISLGIATDDAVHFVVRYQNRINQGDADNALADTSQYVGRAVFITTVVIICGFLAVCLSDFVPTRLFGAFTALVLATSFASTVLIIPALLDLFYKRCRYGTA